MSLACPHCGLVSPEGAAACDCGWNFATAGLPARPEAGRPATRGWPSPRRRAVVWTLFLALCTPTLVGIVVGLFGARETAGWVLVLSIPAWPMALALGVYVWRAEPPGSPARMAALIALGVATLGPILVVASLVGAFLGIVHRR